MNYTFLREYTPEELNINKQLVLNSITKLPFTLSFPINKLALEIEKENYGRAMNYALDFFEISTQYLSCILLINLIEIEKNLNIEKRQTSKIISKIDNKRPLSFGDWLNDIFNPLVAISISEMPDSAFVKALQSNLFVRNNNILLGYKKNASIVQIRNEYKGHSTTLSEEIYKGVIYTLEPRILKLLSALEVIHLWEFYSKDNNKIISHKGFESINDPEFDNNCHNYYIKTNEGKSFDLFPLVFRNDKNYIYVFQSLKEENISYISSNENAVTLISDIYNEHFDSKLQIIDPSFDISKDLNWDQIRQHCDKESLYFLDRIYREKKYNQELFIDREELSILLDNFYKSGKIALPLLGEPGQGKTNQLCYWTEKHIDKKDSIITFTSSDFSQITLENKLKKIFDLSPKKDINKFINYINNIAKQNNQYIYIFFDAINECLKYKDEENTEGPLALYNDIIKLFINQNYTQFKILFTCRSYTWKNSILSTASKNPNFLFHLEGQETSVKGFNDIELSKAYKIYSSLYQMITPYEKLQASTKIRLKDPLVLKIACTNYLCKELPSINIKYSSVALFDDMITNISNSYAGKKQCEIIFNIANYFVTKYQKGEACDRIYDKELKRAFYNPKSNLYHLANLIYKKDGLSIAYCELLNKPERPILRLVKNDNDKNGAQIQFIYERFLEYVMAKVIIKNAANNISPIPAEYFINSLQKSALNEVYMGTLRNALIMDFLRTKSYDTIISLSRDYHNNFQANLIINELFNVLINENYEDNLFSLIHLMINENIENGNTLINEFNEITSQIESNKATPEIISRHKELHKILLPLISLKKLVVISTLNGIFLSDYFLQNLYKNDPYKILWALMTDPIRDVANDTCMYTYYLSNKKYSLSYTPINKNLTEEIVKQMYILINGQPLVKSVAISKRRSKFVKFYETAIRITVLLIIDALLSDDKKQAVRVPVLLDEIKSAVAHLTFNFKLVKVIMPFFQIILRKQLTFQSAYVNNVIEYQTFWDESIIPIKSDSSWSREDISKIIEFSSFKNDKNGLDDFLNMKNKILNAYTLGDSFSYFILERVLVIMGSCSWEYVAPIIRDFFKEENRKSDWFDYSQMSILYVLYQIENNSKTHIPELLEIYTKEAKDWTTRLKGYFKARNSTKANTLGLYKRNVMNWYSVVYQKHIGDGNSYKEDKYPSPLFFEVIDNALENNDKDLLVHLLENISELISDYGYIETALALLKHIMKKIDSKEKLDILNNLKSNRDGIYKQNIEQIIGNVLGTAKNYNSEKINLFIKKDIVGLSFPGISMYREELLNYHPSGETLSDLFTHKFGNFLMWSLLNEIHVGNFAKETIKSAVISKDCFKWFDNVVRILFINLFNIKL